MKIKIFITSVFLFALLLQMKSQENTTTEQKEMQNFSLSSDLVTNYIWRGLIFSNKPNLQPYLAFTNDKGNFSVGAWGSYSLVDYYSEADLFVSNTIGLFTFSIWDYFLMTEQANNKYLNFDKETTSHLVEAVISFNGPESFPIELVASTFVYGSDRNINGDNYYSTYFEAGYPFKWKANNLKLFIGMTPKEGLYAPDIAVVNIGVKNSRQIKITDKFSMPISGSIILNPNTENIFFVLAITFASND